MPISSFTQWSRKVCAFSLAAALLAGGSVAVGGALVPAGQASAASSSAAHTDVPTAVKTLNSFYKPALEGRFPGNAAPFQIGVTTYSEVVEAFGKPMTPKKNADGFDVYTAEMGNPGYAFAYKGNKLREMRYYGTNVERQTNIGGITVKMLKQQWYAPSSTAVIKTGKIKQTKIVYIRGQYQLEFIFNSSTELDHINLLRKGS